MSMLFRALRNKQCIFPFITGMAPNSTYEVRVAYTGTSRIRVHLTPAGVFTKDDEIIHIMDHRVRSFFLFFISQWRLLDGSGFKCLGNDYTQGETIVMSNSYQSKINAFSADMDLIRHTQARSERTLAECGGCSSTDDDFEPSRLEGGTTDLQSSRPPDDSANMDGPCCSDAPAGGQADAWPVRRRRGRMLKDVEKVVFVTDASGGIRGGRAAVVMQVIRDGVHFTGAALPEDMVYHVVLMRMAGAIPFDAFFLVSVSLARPHMHILMSIPPPLCPGHSLLFHPSPS